MQEPKVRTHIEFSSMTDLRTCQDCGEVMTDAEETVFTQCDRCLRHVDHN
ncbi:protein YhfH [Shouchella shacheensis]